MKIENIIIVGIVTGKYLEIFKLNTMILFKECEIAGYKARTIENAKADVTLAIATDFNTPGEICTRNAVKQHRNTYIQVDLNTMMTMNQVKVVIAALEERMFYTLNIAGNGIYSLKDICTQDKLDTLIYQFLCRIFNSHVSFPTLIVSGGQTGIDEAGLKAANKLAIKTLCVAPKDWVYRDINGVDIYNEETFKKRFDS